MVAVTGALLATCDDADLRRELQLRRGLALLALGWTSEGIEAVDAACLHAARGPAGPERSR